VAKLTLGDFMSKPVKVAVWVAVFAALGYALTIYMITPAAITSR
jgi:hypothetical protein